MYRLIILIIIISSSIYSQSFERWHEIEIGKTHAIKSEHGEELLDNSYLFKWTSPINHPDKSINFNIEPKYEINKNTYLFTPYSPGIYMIELNITDIEHNILFKEKFFFNVIEDSLNNSNSPEIKNNEDIEYKDEVEINESEQQDEKRFTIQVAVWQTLEKAIYDKEYLKSIGYDAYIEEKEQGNGIAIFRVRVGSFSSRELAIKTRNLLLEKESVRWGKELWIANTK